MVPDGNTDSTFHFALCGRCLTVLGSATPLLRRAFQESAHSLCPSMRTLVQLNIVPDDDDAQSKIDLESQQQSCHICKQEWRQPKIHTLDHSIKTTSLAPTKLQMVRPQKCMGEERYRQFRRSGSTESQLSASASTATLELAHSHRLNKAHAKAL